MGGVTMYYCFIFALPCQQHAASLSCEGKPYTFVCCARRYVLAEVSGANFNPAVSFGLLLGKRISLERFIMYVIAQVC